MSYTFESLQLLLTITAPVTAEMAIPIGIPTEEVKAEIKTHPVFAEI